jgi:hypothetical protein
MNKEEVVKAEKDLSSVIDAIFPSDFCNFPDDESRIKAINNCSNILFDYIDDNYEVDKSTEIRPEFKLTDLDKEDK